MGIRSGRGAEPLNGGENDISCLGADCDCWFPMLPPVANDGDDTCVCSVSAKDEIRGVEGDGPNRPCISAVHLKGPFEALFAFSADISPAGEFCTVASLFGVTCNGKVLARCGKLALNSSGALVCGGGVWFPFPEELFEQIGVGVWVRFRLISGDERACLFRSLSGRYLNIDYRLC